jgi:hypothetical protein
MDAELKSAFDAIQQNFADLRRDNVEMLHGFAELRQDNVEMRQGIAELRQDNVAIWQEIAEIRRETASIREENVSIRKENAAMHTETRQLFVTTIERNNADLRHFFVVTTESMRRDIQLLAEGLAQTRVDLARTATELDAKIDRTAAETQAMIKFSHDSLDRRLRVLETSAR